MDGLVGVFIPIMDDQAIVWVSVQKSAFNQGINKNIWRFFPGQCLRDMLIRNSSNVSLEAIFGAKVPKHFHCSHCIRKWYLQAHSKCLHFWMFGCPASHDVSRVRNVLMPCVRLSPPTLVVWIAQWLP